MRLSEFVRKYPEFKPYVDFLSDFLERPPDEIEAYSLEEIERFGCAHNERMLGSALWPDKLFFREMPPSTYVFIHELIHLCKKPEGVPEEMYAYNLVDQVMFCVEKEIKCNPFKLFKLRIEDIERVLERYSISSVEEYYTLVGIVPVGYTLVERDGAAWVAPSEELLRSPDYERKVTEIFVTELVSGIPFYTENSTEARILLDLVLGNHLQR